MYPEHDLREVSNRPESRLSLDSEHYQIYTLFHQVTILAKVSKLQG